MTAFLSPSGATHFEDSAPPRKLLVATADGVTALQREGPGSPWGVAGRSLVGQHVSSLVMEPGGRIFAGVYKGGAFRSDDGGQTWKPLTMGRALQDVFSLAVAQESTGPVLYAGTEPASLFRSANLGDTWRELPAMGLVPGAEKWRFPPPPHVPHTKTITLDGSRPATLYVTIEQGALLRSEDAGLSWTELNGFSDEDDSMAYRDVHRLVQAPWDPTRLFVTTGVGFYRSLDTGQSWERVRSVEAELGYPDAMVASPQGDRTLLVAGARRNPLQWFSHGAAEGTVLRSRDEGKTWEPARDGLPRARSNLEAMSLVAYPGGATVFVGNTEGEVYASDSFGEHWSLIASGVGPVSKGSHHGVIRTASEAPAWVRPLMAAAVSTLTRVTSRVALAARARRLKRERAAASSR